MLSLYFPAPADLTKEVASDLPERHQTSSLLKDQKAGDLLGPTARSHTPKEGFVSAASPSQDRWADVSGKDAEAVTTATPQVTDPGTGLTMGRGKGILERRPASSPVKRIGKGSTGDQRRPTSRSQTSTHEEFLQHGGCKRSLFHVLACAGNLEFIRSYVANIEIVFCTIFYIAFQKLTLHVRVRFPMSRMSYE